MEIDFETMTDQMCRNCRYFEREKSYAWGFCKIPLPFFVEPDGVVCDDEGADCRTHKGVEDVHIPS